MDAICSQLLVIAENWDGAGYDGPAPSSPEEQEAVATKMVDAMSDASAELARLGPPDLAYDAALQVEWARQMLASMAGQPASTEVDVGEILTSENESQERLESFATHRCSFSIWDFEAS